MHHGIVMRGFRILGGVLVLAVAVALQLPVLLGRNAPSQRDLVRPGFYDLVEVAYTGFPGEPPARSRAEWIAEVFEGRRGDPGPAGLPVEVAADRRKVRAWHMDTDEPIHECALEFVSVEDAATLAEFGELVVWLDRGSKIQEFLVLVPGGVWWVLETRGSESKHRSTRKYRWRGG